ncbi:MAG: NHL repeat-containing protein [Pirellulaceae bacterium]
MISMLDFATTRTRAASPGRTLGSPVNGALPSAWCCIFAGLAGLSLLLLATTGCTGGAEAGRPDKIWGRRGLGEGRFQKPRAIAIDSRDDIYVVDMTGRIQVFTAEGEFLRSWRTPAVEAGKPCGLSFDRAGNLLVADTHYFRVLMYTPAGTLLEDRTIGGTNGHGPGEFYFLTDVVEDSRGNYYVCEYGDYDRIQKFRPDGQFELQWGKHGNAPGDFVQPRGMAVDARDQLYVTDACNHRIQIFDVSVTPPRLVRLWGREGSGPGELRYPYGIELDPEGNVYIAEFGNSRVQKFTAEGKLLAQWGTPGRREGELDQPWALGLDSQGRLHVVDSYNHRIQRIRL